MAPTRRPTRVGDVFRVVEGDVATIRFEGGHERLDRVGLGLSEGAIEVEGDVGVEAGRAMTGGRLTIRGDAGPFAGSGLRGGELVIAGNAGARAADRLPRGVVLIEGRAGASAGSRMIAGTLAIGGEAGELPGYLMDRGTIVLGGGAARLSPTFADCGEYDLIAARLIADYVAPLSARLASLFRRRQRRLADDLAALGKGEIWLPAGLTETS